MAMQHKNIDIEEWLEDMHKTTTHGDDIALYILSRMFNKHVFVHNSKYGWCTMPYRTEDSHQDIVAKCDLELVFLKCWAFGEVKKIRGPVRTILTNVEESDSTRSSKADKSSGVVSPKVIPGSVESSNIIPGNARCKSTRAAKQTIPLPKKKVTQRTSTRKRPAVDYSKLDDGSDIPSPPHKRCKPNLLKKPSKTVLAAHKKRKQMSPFGTMKRTTKPVTMNPTPTPSSSGTNTSTGQQIGTVMVSASTGETKTAIAALLSLGSDIPQPDEDVTAENVQLMPINPNTLNIAADSIPASTASSAGTKIKPSTPSTPSTAVPVHRRFLTKEYKLKRRVK